MSIDSGQLTAFLSIFSSVALERESGRVGIEPFPSCQIPSYCSQFW